MARLEGQGPGVPDPDLGQRIVASALALVALGSGLTVFMTTTWQLILLWGVLVGLGTGSMALAFVATDGVAHRRLRGARGGAAGAGVPPGPPTTTACPSPPRRACSP